MTTTTQHTNLIKLKAETGIIWMPTHNYVESKIKHFRHRGLIVNATQIWDGIKGVGDYAEEIRKTSLTLKVSWVWSTR